MRCRLQVRRDLVFVSSVLFTIALVSLITSEVANVRAMYPSLELDGCMTEAARQAGESGVVSLTVILIGLIVIWAGFVKRIRWTWFVMFIIVFGWAFTVLVLPLLGTLEGTPSQFILAAVRGPGPARDVVEAILIFSLMVIALILPARSFFSRS